MRRASGGALVSVDGPALTILPSSIMNVSSESSLPVFTSSACPACTTTLLGLGWAMSCTASKSIAAVSVARRCHLFTGQAPLVRSDCYSKPGSGRLRESAGEPPTGESSLPRMKRRQSQKRWTRVSVLHDQIKCPINGPRSGHRAPRDQVYRTRLSDQVIGPGLSDQVYRTRFILPGRH